MFNIIQCQNMKFMLKLLTSMLICAPDLLKVMFPGQYWFSVRRHFF